MLNEEYFDNLYKMYAPKIDLYDFASYKNNRNEFLRKVIEKLTLPDSKWKIINEDTSKNWQKITMERESDKKQFLLKYCCKKIETGSQTKNFDVLREEFFRESFYEFAILVTYGHELSITDLPIGFAKGQFHQLPYVLVGILFDCSNDSKQAEQDSSID